MQMQVIREHAGGASDLPMAVDNCISQVSGPLSIWGPISRWRANCGSRTVIEIVKVPLPVPLRSECRREVIVWLGDDEVMLTVEKERNVEGGGETSEAVLVVGHIARK